MNKRYCNLCLGRNCEKKIDWCKTNPCQNNATCHLEEGTSTSFNCINCPNGYAGELCHVKNWLCKHGVNKCLNGASCKDRGVYATCDCKAGFTGYKELFIYRPYDLKNLCLLRLKKLRGNCRINSVRIF